jgi:hypothetical protein
MRPWICLFLIVFVGAGSAAVATARDLFVDNIGGDDRANGHEPRSTTEAGPVKTITRALSLAEPGDRIHLAKNAIPYRESISLSGGDHSGFVVSPFTIVGNGATLDGSLPVPAREWESVRENLYRFHPPRGSHPMLFLDGRPAPRRPVSQELAKLPALAPGEWCAHDGFIYFAAERGKLPREYALTYAALPVGITFYQVKNVAVLDLVVQGFHTDGVSAPDGARNVRLAGLILRGNGRAGLAVGGASQVTADGCLIGNNGTEQVLVNGYGTLGLGLCELLEGTVPKIVRNGGRVFIDGALQE